MVLGGIEYVPALYQVQVGVWDKYWEFVYCSRGWKERMEDGKGGDQAVAKV